MISQTWLPGNTPVQMFSCEFYKTFTNNFFDRTPPPVVSVESPACNFTENRQHRSFPAIFAKLEDRCFYRTLPDECFWYI